MAEGGPGRLFTGLAWQSRWAIAGGLAALVAVDLLQLYIPRLVKFAVDDLALGRATSASLAGQGLAVLGRITAGDFVAFTSYLGILTWPMIALGWVVSLMQRAGASLKQVNDMLSTAPAITDPASPHPLPAARPLGLSVKGLTFAYADGEEPALTGAAWTWRCRPGAPPPS